MERRCVVHPEVRTSCLWPMTLSYITIRLFILEFPNVLPAFVGCSVGCATGSRGEGKGIGISHSVSHTLCTNIQLKAIALIIVQKVAVIPLPWPWICSAQIVSPSSKYVSPEVSASHDWLRFVRFVGDGAASARPARPAGCPE